MLLSEVLLPFARSHVAKGMQKLVELSISQVAERFLRRAAAVSVALWLVYGPTLCVCVGTYAGNGETGLLVRLRRGDATGVDSNSDHWGNSAASVDCVD